MTGAEDFAQRFPNWERDCRAYIEAREAQDERGWAHAECDHAYGYCVMGSE